MATSVTIYVQGSLDGTTVKSELTLSVSARTATSVTFSYTAKCGFVYTSGETGAGYESYTGYLTISNSSLVNPPNDYGITLKSTSEGWPSGSTGWRSTKTDSFTVNTTSYADLACSVTWAIKSSQDSYKPSNSGSINTGSGAVIPTAPTVTATTNISQVSNYFYIGYNRDTQINLACVGGENINQYDYQVSRNGNAYSSISGGFISNTSFDYTLPQDFTVSDTLEFVVVVNSSTSDTATSSATSPLTAKYRTPDSVTITSPSSATVIPCIDQPGVTWASVPQNISYYRVQYTPPSGTAVSTTVPNSTLTYTLPVSITLDPGNSIRFTITPVNPTTSGSSVTSATITAGGGLYTKQGGVYKLGAPYVKVGGSWKKGCTYIKKNGVWVLTE